MILTDACASSCHPSGQIEHCGHYIKILEVLDEVSAFGETSGINLTRSPTANVLKRLALAKYDSIFWVHKYTYILYSVDTNTDHFSPARAMHAGQI